MRLLTSTPPYEMTKNHPALDHWDYNTNFTDLIQCNNGKIKRQEKKTCHVKQWNFPSQNLQLHQKEGIKTLPETAAEKQAAHQVQVWRLDQRNFPDVQHASLHDGACEVD
ncbi:hypothetical protein PoB_001803200 [Plakobranchus ocellatus]|uniref:Uncharacterized protein n=1 Tax=Plakobranchus ocellatus TaxID=259542 RepID=A0AAV3ZAL6_9GAST|nr:hypothetical protein PoB_001803200 [Plakobranchus ocellatus]